MLLNMLYVGIGGFLGANARYIIAGWLTTRFLQTTGWHLPVGTAFVNVTGSFLLALFSVWVSRKGNFSPEFTLLVGTGFFGAYTTFSTYANESIALLTQRTPLASSVSTTWQTGIAYIVLTNVLCLIGVLAGIGIANRLWTTP